MTMSDSSALSFTIYRNVLRESRSLRWARHTIDFNLHSASLLLC